MLVSFPKTVYRTEPINADKDGQELDVSDPNDQRLIFRFFKLAEQKFQISNQKDHSVSLTLKKCLAMA